MSTPHQHSTRQAASTDAIAPVLRSKTAARQAYNRMSRWYDWMAGASERKYRQAGLTVLQPHPGESILEIGCGTGHSLEEIAAAVGENGLVCGLDLAENMIRISRERLKAKELSGQTLLLQGDGAALPFQSGQFDAVFLSFTLELFAAPELVQVLAACHTVLKPDGRLILVTMTSSTTPSWTMQAYLRLRRFFPQVLDCRPIPVETLLQNASFIVVSQQTFSMFGFPVIVINAEKESPA
ncbi:MAG: class I SAM-dependent methyltransferase [Anaerolineales bacterium]|nr:class I SAM-dependent methyltransferase [Anaerolineales bacterium]